MCTTGPKSCLQVFMPLRVKLHTGPSLFQDARWLTLIICVGEEKWEKHVIILLMASASQRAYSNTQWRFLFKFQIHQGNVSPHFFIKFKIRGFHVGDVHELKCHLSPSL